MVPVLSVRVDPGDQVELSVGEPFERSELWRWWREQGRDAAADAMEALCRRRLSPDHHGDLPRWLDAWDRLPRIAGARIDASGDAVRVATDHLADHPADPRIDTDAVRQALLRLHPWRKGPFHILGVDVDAEWRSDLKWNRLASAVDFRGRAVLDVGCGNGYYGWRMLAAGAEFVMGCDPSLLPNIQFQAMRKYAEPPERHFVVPLGDVDLPRDAPLFDVVVSMGVLYHRPHPIDHLERLVDALKPGGELLVETLVIDGDASRVLVPEGRYAKMRNVWFLPSLELLAVWLRRVGLREFRVIDVTATTPREQRRTEWMKYESLADFLDPNDPARTIEGHPAPLRGMVIARKPP